MYPTKNDLPEATRARAVELLNLVFLGPEPGRSCTTPAGWPGR